MNVNCYDKIHQMVKQARADRSFKMNYKDRAGDVLRIEFQMKGDKLKRCLSDSASYPRTLSIEQAYSCYRELVSKFGCKEPQGLTSKTEVFLATMAEAEEAGLPLHDGRSPLEHLSEHVKPACFNKHRKLMQAYLLRGNGVVFPEILPATWPPPRHKVAWTFFDLDEHQSGL